MTDKKYMIKTFKEIILIIIAIILLFGGLGLILTAVLANGVVLIGIILIGLGSAIFAYILKDCWRYK